jgi:hypothetical protein
VQPVPERLEAGRHLVPLDRHQAPALAAPPDRGLPDSDIEVHCVIDGLLFGLIGTWRKV